MFLGFLLLLPNRDAPSPSFLVSFFLPPTWEMNGHAQSKILTSGQGHMQAAGKKKVGLCFWGWRQSGVRSLSRKFQVPSHCNNSDLTTVLVWSPQYRNGWKWGAWDHYSLAGRPWKLSSELHKTHYSSLFLFKIWMNTKSASVRVQKCSQECHSSS